MNATPIQYPLIHQVFFWLKNATNANDCATLIKGIHTLSAIETILQINIGTPASTESRDVIDNSWQVSETIIFENTAAQLLYQQHPIHVAFIKNYSHLWHKVLVYDIKTV
jgi:hypothetical protein